MRDDRQVQVWPSKYPRFTLLGMVAPLLLLGVFRDYLMPRLAPIERFYQRRFLWSWVGGQMGRPNTSGLVYVVDRGGRARPAMDGDVAPVPRTGDGLPFALTLQAVRDGARGLLDLRVDQVTPGRLRTAAEYHRFLAIAFYGGDVGEVYRWPFAFLVFSWIVGIPAGVMADWRVAQRARFGIKLRGPDLVTRWQFNRDVKGDGMAFTLSNRRNMAELFGGEKVLAVRIPRRSESQSVELIGDTGSGKSSLIYQMLQQIEARGELAVIYDPDRQFIERFYREDRGDWDLNPVDRRCPYWHPGSEVEGRSMLEKLAAALPIASALYPYRGGEQQFFVKHAQDIFAYLLATHSPSAAQLGEWFQHPKQLDRMVQGTEHAETLSKNSPGQRQGILGTLNHAAYAMRLVPDRASASRSWTSREWTRERRGWIFITSTPATQEALQPLQSLWIDSLILNVLSDGKREGVPPVWFVLDELASLQYLPQLQNGVTRSRKTGNPFVLGFQGRAQLDKLYKEEAETILSQPATKFLLRTSEARAAEWMSKMVGEIEVERATETRGPDGRRSWSSVQQKKELVLPSQFAGLNDLEGYMRHGSYVVKIKFDWMAMEPLVPGLIPRDYSTVEPPGIPVDDSEDEADGAEGMTLMVTTGSGGPPQNGGLGQRPLFVPTGPVPMRDVQHDRGGPF